MTKGEKRSDYDVLDLRRLLFQVALNPFQIFLNVLQKLSFNVLIIIEQWIMGVTLFCFESLTLKVKIRGLFDTIYCCYGNLICQEDHMGS